MPRRRALRLLLVGTAVTLVVAVLAAVAVAATVVRRPLPAHEGTLDVAGLESTVTVLRDERGVPQLYADTPEDLFTAQGFVHAQDRFFEMDYRRHVTAGRLSELVGVNEAALAADKVIRTFGWRRVAEEEWRILDPETRAYLQAYADGVNAYLDARTADSLALEYAVLGVQVEVDEPEPWDPVDSLAWLKAMAWDLRGNYDKELSRAMTYATLRDVELVEDLFPRYPYEEHPPILGEPVPVEDVPADEVAADQVAGLLLEEDLARALEATHAALDAVPHLVGEGEGVGSNSWVVAGEHTASGLPILANDPHLDLAAPGIWFQMGLHCRQVGQACPFEVAGFSFAGFPGIIIGHNARLAWALTNLGADVTDFFLERTTPAEGTYTRDGEQVPVEVRTEVIEVNGAPSVEIEVRSTVHGPIVSDVLPVAPVMLSPTADGLRGTTEVALGWTALEPTRTAEAVFALAVASDAEDIAAVGASFAVPSQNILFATTDGQIGYQSPGRIPVRARVLDGPVPSDGTWPRPGWDSRYDWQGYVDPAAMPSAVNPEKGFLVTANQAVNPPGVGPFLTADWDYGYRAERLRERLAEMVADADPITVEAMHELQLDTWSPYADALVPALLATPVENPFTLEAVELLREWDGEQDVDSAAGAYFAAVWATLLELTFWDDLPESEWPSGDSRWLAVVEDLLEEPDSPWWDDRRTVNIVESRDEILRRSLAAARLELTVKLGKDPEGWRWGRLHTLSLQHPVLGGEGVPGPVRRLVNPAPLAMPGGSSIVNATAWDAADGDFAVTAGPSMRMVVDLSELDGSTWVASTGVSGHPGSPHYADQLGAWARGETFPWPFSEDAVRESAEARATLRPPP